MYQKLDSICHALFVMMQLERIGLVRAASRGALAISKHDIEIYIYIYTFQLTLQLNQTPDASRLKEETMPEHTHTHNQALVIGISGPSSSGKTTLARLLLRVFSPPPSSPSSILDKTFIIHEDDFYLPDDRYVPSPPLPFSPHPDSILHAKVVC